MALLLTHLVKVSLKRKTRYNHRLHIINKLIVAKSPRTMF